MCTHTHSLSLYTPKNDIHREFLCKISFKMYKNYAYSIYLLLESSIHWRVCEVPLCVCVYEHNMNFTCRIVCHMNNLYIGGTDMIWLLLYIDRETIHGRNEKQKKKDERCCLCVIFNKYELRSNQNSFVFLWGMLSVLFTLACQTHCHSVWIVDNVELKCYEMYDSVLIWTPKYFGLHFLSHLLNTHISGRICRTFVPCC